MRMLKSAVLCATALVPVPTLANVAEESEQRTIIVTGARDQGTTATKTDTPII